MGVTKKPAVIAKTAPKKRGRPVGSKNKVQKDTRPLVEQLQEALAIEMKTVQGMEKLFEEFKSVAVKVSDLTFWQRVKLAFTGKY